MARENDFKLCNRFIEPVLFEQKLAEVKMRDVVLLGHGKCSIPKSFGVVPVGSLNPRPPSEESDDDRPCGGENFAAITNRFGRIDNRPRRRDIEPNL